MDLRKASGVNILMYHSVSIGPRPLAIRPDTFRMQLDILAECGFRGVALRDYISSPDTSRIVVLTFDDGYVDFAETAFPEIESRGWGCTLFLSSDLVDGSWDPDGSGQRALIDWRQASRLAQAGVEIGSHGVTHADLTALSADQAALEITRSKDEIERRADCGVVSFAAPYGRSTPSLRTEIARTYRCAVGTTLARATPASDRYDLPRIEMWYFRKPARWRSYLNGSTAYFSLRRALRQAGSSWLLRMSNR